MLEFISGTSRNENFHHFLNGKKSPFTGHTSIFLLDVILDFIVLEWNNKCVFLWIKFNIIHNRKENLPELLPLKKGVFFFQIAPLPKLSIDMLKSQGFKTKSDYEWTNAETAILKGVLNLIYLTLTIQ